MLRLLTGVASALIFVTAVSSLHSHLREHPTHVSGWAFGGAGAGIALSGLLVLALRSVADWRAAWLASATLAAVLTLVSWRLRPERAPAPPRHPAGSAGRASVPAAGSMFCSPPTPWKASATAAARADPDSGGA
ncbi:YbfB/YjiJ family MFS transporter [Actinopolymorpha pittospori]